MEIVSIASLDALDTRVRPIDDIVDSSLDLNPALKYIEKLSFGPPRPGVYTFHDIKGHTIIWEQNDSGGGHVNMLKIDRLGTRLDASWLPIDGQVVGSQAAEQRILSIASAKNGQGDYIGNVAIDGSGNIIEVGINQTDSKQTPATNFVNSLLTYALRGPFEIA